MFGGEDGSWWGKWRQRVQSGLKLWDLVSVAKSSNLQQAQNVAAESLVSKQTYCCCSCCSCGFHRVNCGSSPD